MTPPGALSAAALVAALLPPAAEDPAPRDAPPFREVGAEWLPGVVSTCGGPDKDYILETNGGGVVLGDFDGDGDLDLVLIDGSTLERVRAGEPGLPPRLFLNDGTGRFAPAGEAWAMAGGTWGTGGAAGDVDGDGDLDLWVGQWGRDRLYLNEAGAGFREVEAGFAGERWASSGAFLDYDGDGVLDLVVVNYLAFDPEEIQSRADGGCEWKGHAVMCGPEGLEPQHDQLYRGRGDGTFEEVTLEAGFRPERAGYGLGALTFDYDGDGDTDVYVTNDSTPNHLWRNEGDGTFREVGLALGVSHDNMGKEQAGMGVASGDLNGDAVPDILVTNFSAENNALYVSRKLPKRVEYVDGAAPSGLGRSRRALGWSTAIEDFDQDGDLDAYVLNGHVYPQADRPGTDTSYAQEDHFYRNGGGGKFAVEPLSDAGPTVARAGAHGDLDGDGDLDLVALDLVGPVRVLRNDGAAGGWLRVRLAGPGANTQGLGARVEVRRGADQPSLWRDVRTAGGFQASVPAEAHFGLGARVEPVEVVVHWPDGTAATVTDVAPGQVLLVRHPEAGVRQPGAGAGARAAAGSREADGPGSPGGGGAADEPAERAPAPAAEAPEGLGVLAFDPRDLPRAEEGRWALAERSRVDARAGQLAAMAQEAYGADDFPRAIAYLRECLEREPDFPPALQLLGTALFRLQRYSDAAECLERFLAHLPEELWRTQALGHCYYSLGDYERARAHYERVLAETPEELPDGALAEARRGLGLALYRLGEIGPALDELRAVVAARPDHGEAWQWIGQLEYEAGRLDEARAALERSAEVAGHDPRVWFLLAKVYAAQGLEDEEARARARFEDLDRITQEIRAVRAGLRLDPSNYLEAMKLVELCKTTRDVEGVREAVDLVVRARPASMRELDVRVFALKTLLRMGDAQGAGRAAAALEACCAEDPEAWKELATYFATVGDTRRQIEAGERYRRLRSR